MLDLIQSLFAAAPAPQGESARIRSMIDPELARPWMQAQVTVRGGGTFGGLLTTHASGMLRMITPQPTKDGQLLLVDQYLDPSAVMVVATVIEPPRVATRSSGIVMG